MVALALELGDNEIEADGLELGVALSLALGLGVALGLAERLADGLNEADALILELGEGVALALELGEALGVALGEALTLKDMLEETTPPLTCVHTAELVVPTFM